MIVLISGGSGLIGSQVCRSLVTRNIKVIIADNNVEKSKKLVKELGKKKSFFIKTDVTNSKSIDKALLKASKIFGKIDAAIHSAYPKTKNWGKKFEELNEKDLALNLKYQLGSAIIFSQRLILFFKKQGYGNLIHISSIQGISAPKFEHYKGTKMTSPIEYSAIKSGIINITRYLAKYYKNSNIRVNCLSPGGIKDRQPKIFLQRYKKSCLKKGMLDTIDILGSIFFLLSEDSKYINGQNLIIDDGWSL